MIKTEKMEPLLLRRLQQPRPVYRMNTGRGRLYYTLNENGDPFFYQSVTTFIARSTPTSEHLIKWKVEKGLQESERYTEERARYGTMMHVLISYLITLNKWDCKNTEATVREFYEREGWELPEGTVDELNRDLIAFARWAIDYEFDCFAIEMVLASDRMKIAGAVDLIGEISIMVDGLDYENPYKTGARAGQPREIKVKKRVECIIDLKSNRKGFHDDNAVQLTAYRELFLENFPEYRNREFSIFNWSPKEWKTTPSYNFKDQSDSIDVRKLEHLIAIADIEERKIDRTLTVFDGVIEISRGDEGLKNVYRQVTMSEAILTSKIESNGKPEEVTD